VSAATSDVPDRGSYASGRLRRAQILQLAKQQFARGGYQRTSTAAIARAAGITEGGLLHHFSSKTTLLHEVLALSEQESGELAQELLSGSASVAALFSTIVDLAEHNAQVPGLIELYVILSAEAVTADHPAHDWFLQRYHRLNEATVHTLRRGTECGEIRPDAHCESIARETLAVQDGLQLQWVLSGAQFDLVGAVRDYVGRLAASLQP
jgi:AcrR family transcriptional regulator